MIASRLTTQLFSTIMIAFLIVTTGYVLVPAPAHHSEPNVAAQEETSVALAGAMLPSATQGDANLASPHPVLPDRSAGCSLCNTNPGVAAVIVQLDAASLNGGTQHATNVFSQIRPDLARTMAQRQPDPLERPPAA